MVPGMNLSHKLSKTGSVMLTQYQAGRRHCVLDRCCSCSRPGDSSGPCGQPLTQQG